jgi:hypothetical protein
MNHARSEKKDDSQFEKFFAMPKGGMAARCQARRTNGTQCGMVARTGFDKCWRHGPGAAKRETPLIPGTRASKMSPAQRGKAEIERRGRPRKDGLDMLLVTDKDWQLNKLVREVLDADVDIDDTRVAMAALHALLSKEMARAPKIQATAEQLDQLLVELSEIQPRTIEEVQSIANTVRSVQRLRVGMIFHFERVRDTAEAVVRSAHRRADTRNKDADMRLLEQFLRWVVILRNLIWEQIPDPRVLDAIEHGIQTQVLKPMGIDVEFPALDAADEGEIDDGLQDEELFRS